VIGAGAVGAGMIVSGCATAGTGDTRSASVGAPAGTTLGPASAVPVGGATIFEAQGVVVTQPIAGSFAAISAACPHQGCAVARVQDASIICPCHGSTFGLDGSLMKGPAAEGLASRGITVANDQLMLS
jgi:Rieske Fe-S protein